MKDKFDIVHNEIDKVIYDTKQTPSPIQPKMSKTTKSILITIVFILIGFSIGFTITYYPLLDNDFFTTDSIVQRAEPYIEKIFTNDIELRAYANSIISDCPSNDKECQINAIYRHIVENYNYVSDPMGIELIQLPQETIKIKGGDCEDLSILLNSLLENIGIRTYLVLTEEHAYSLAYDIDSQKLWSYIEPSLINQVEKDWGDSVRQHFSQTFVLEGKHNWYYGGNGESLGEYIDYLNIDYSIESNQPLHLYIVPSKDDFNKLTQGETFYQYPNNERENVLSISNKMEYMDCYGGIILANEGWQDATISVDFEFYFKPSFYELFGDEVITHYDIDGVSCVVLDPTAGVYGFPGYDAGIEGEKIAIDPITKEYLFLG